MPTNKNDKLPIHMTREFLWHFRDLTNDNKKYGWWFEGKPLKKKAVHDGCFMATEGVEIIKLTASFA